MGINLMDLAKGYLGQQVMSKASSFLGESPSATSSAMDAILPSVLGGLMSKASSKNGAKAVFDMVNDDMNDGGILDDLGGIFAGGDASNAVSNFGSSMLGNIFGGNQSNGLIDLITSVSGMKRGSSSSLLSMAVPMIMGLLGKQTRSKGLDVGGLAKMLLGQKKHIAAAAPAGLTSLLGINSFDDVEASAKSSWGSALDWGQDKVEEVSYSTRETVTETRDRAAAATASTVEEASSSGGGILGKLLPILGLLLLGGFLWFFAKGCGEGKSVTDATKGAVESVGSTVKKGTDATVGAAKGAAAKTGEVVGDAANATGNAVKGAAGAAGDAANATVGAAKDAANATGNAVKGAAGAAGDAVKGAAEATGDAVKGAAEATGDAVKGAAEATGDAVKGAAKATKDAIKKLGPSADEMKLPKNSVEAKMANFLSGGGTAASAAKERTFTLPKVKFETGKATLTKDSQAQLNNLAKVLSQYKDIRLEVQGHTDNTGNAASNKKLSQQRADAVKAYLANKKVDLKRIVSKGYGDTKPIADNKTEAGKKQNRRTDIMIIK